MKKISNLIVLSLVIGVILLSTILFVNYKEHIRNESLLHQQSYVQKPAYLTTLNIFLAISLFIFPILLLISSIYYIIIKHKKSYKVVLESLIFPAIYLLLVVLQAIITVIFFPSSISGEGSGFGFFILIIISVLLVIASLIINSIIYHFKR